KGILQRLAFGHLVFSLFSTSSCSAQTKRIGDFELDGPLAARVFHGTGGEALAFQASAVPHKAQGQRAAYYHGAPAVGQARATRPRTNATHCSQAAGGCGSTH